MSGPKEPLCKCSFLRVMVMQTHQSKMCLPTTPDRSVLLRLQAEPYLMQELLESNAIVSSVLRYGTVQHVAYHVNQSALEEFSANARANARAAGEKESNLVGLHLLKRVKTPIGFTLSEIWFYQVPRSKTYLLVVTGYEPLAREAFCGSLSLHCSRVFDPLETKIVTRYGYTNSQALRTLCTIVRRARARECNEPHEKSWY